VPGCRSNYDGETEKISSFSFPRDSTRRALWLRKIPRDNYEPSAQSVVCEKHFSEEFIVRFDSATRTDGSILTVKRDRPKLSNDAYPSIFPNCPAYLSSEPAPKRRKPEERQQALQERDEKTFSEWMKADRLSSFSDFNDGLENRIGDKWICKKHVVVGESTGSTNTQYTSLYCIQDFPAPKLVSAVKVFEDLQVQVFVDNAGKFIS
jgi:hypothetical protein